MLVLTLARVSLSPGDLVRYLPRFDDEYRKELAFVKRILGEDKEPLPPGPDATPYWLEVKFKKDGKTKTLNAQAFVVEEVRQTVARIL